MKETALLSAVCAAGVAGAALLLFGAGTARSAEPPSPQPQQELKPMLKITWTRGPDLPQGFQDSDGGFLGRRLITVAGFCSGIKADQERKPGRYPRGFLKKTWAWDSAHPTQAWESLPDFPGAARQGVSAAVVNRALYVWGGFSYDAPYTYKDGYRLRRQNGEWKWEPLPPLPYPLTEATPSVIGNKIYLFGGADYDTTKFYTDTDRSGNNKRLGARLLVFDTKDPDAGWKQLPECPGTPRWVNSMTAVDGKLYVIGGATGDRMITPPNTSYCTVVDNWKFDPETAQWTRLPDLPVATGNFPKGNVVFKDRYIVLVGGFQYPKIANPDGTYRDSYGHASQVGGVKVARNETAGYYCDMFVYDTRTNRFGTADPLPINNNMPMATVRGDTLYLLGGECDSREVLGEWYGHHPDLFLLGKLEERE